MVKPKARRVESGFSEDFFLSRQDPRSLRFFPFRRNWFLAAHFLFQRGLLTVPALVAKLSFVSYLFWAIPKSNIKSTCVEN